MSVITAGFLLGLSLIVAIGPQNAYIIKMGVTRNSIGPIVLACLISDVLLINAGVGGMGFLVERFPAGLIALKFLGAAYLIHFGFTCFKDALRPNSQGLVANGAQPHSNHEQTPSLARTTNHGTEKVSGNQSAVGTLVRPRRIRTLSSRTWFKPVLGALALTWLNPLAYIDVLVMLGGIANQYGTERWLFALGALLASCLWFPSVGFGAAKLSHVLARPTTWRVINAVIGCVMIALTIKLLMS